jgi:hypothetical protein
MATTPWRTEDLPRELVAPAAGELTCGLVADARQLAFELARKTAQLVRGLFADFAENSFLSSRHLLFLLFVSRITPRETRPRGPKSLALASAPQRNALSQVPDIALRCARER